jgi:hypothetical protein
VQRLAGWLVGWLAGCHCCCTPAHQNFSPERHPATPTPIATHPCPVPCPRLQAW